MSMQVQGILRSQVRLATGDPRSLCAPGVNCFQLVRFASERGRPQRCRVTTTTTTTRTALGRIQWSPIGLDTEEGPSLMGFASWDLGNEHVSQWGHKKTRRVAGVHASNALQRS